VIAFPTRHRCTGALGLTVLLAAFLMTRTSPVAAGHGAAPLRVYVQPVFFVPSDQAGPTPAESQKLMAELHTAQDRYKQLLGGYTFELARSGPAVYKSPHKLDHYRRKDRIAAQFVPELLQHFGYDRYSCPMIFAIVLMNPIDDVPRGGGRPINGGFNNGGGAFAASSWGLDNKASFQSLVEHELGHTFGLPHVKAYGYDRHRNDSIMSYNPKHRGECLEGSGGCGILIPEDKRGLAHNQHAFPGLTFDPKRDVPTGYAIRKIQTLGPMNLDFGSETLQPDEEEE